MTARPYYDRAKAALEEAHRACFNHPDRDILRSAPDGGPAISTRQRAKYEAALRHLEGW